MAIKAVKNYESFNFLVDLVLFPFDIMVSLGESDDELKNKLIELGSDDMEDIGRLLNLDSTVKGRTIMLKGHQTVVRMPIVPKNAFDYGILQHEIFHAVEFILYKIGITHDLDTSNELYAYMIGYVTGEVYKKLGFK